MRWVLNDEKPFNKVRFDARLDEPFDVIARRDVVAGNPNLLTVVFQESLELTLRISDWVEFELKLGLPITVRQYETYLQRARVISASVVAQHYLRFKPRTSGELSRYLKRKMVPDEDIQDVIKMLSDTGAIDDALYTKLFASQQKSKLTSKAIEWRMREKGVDKNVVQEVLSSEIQPEDEGLLAEKLAEKYVRQKGIPQDQKEAARFANFLLRRGVSSEQVRNILSRYFDR
jgi:regulatory protein